MRRTSTAWSEMRSSERASLKKHLAYLKKHLAYEAFIFSLFVPLNHLLPFGHKMKVHESDAKDNLCIATKSSPSLHQQVSVDDCTVGEYWEAVLAGSMSEGPDAIFDMSERYRGKHSSLALRSTSVLEEHEDIEDESFQDKDECETPRDEKDDSNIIDLIQSVKLSEVMERIHSYTHANVPEGRSREPNTPNEILRKRLDDEIEKSRDLARRLEDLENHRQEELIDERENMAALEAELELEQRKSTHLGQKLRAVEESHSIRNRATSKELRQKLEELEMRHKDILSEYVLELNIQETSYGKHLDTAQRIIEFLQRKLAESQEILLSKQDQVETLERSHDSSQALLKSEQKKVKYLKLTDSTNQYLLQTEQKKVKVLVQSISDLESSIENLSRKAMILDGAQDQIMCLTQELERRDSMFASIRQVVNADANPTPRRETEKKDFLSYARQYNALAEASVRVDPMQNTEIYLHPYAIVNRSRGDTPSCVEPACENKTICPAYTRQYNRIAYDGLMPVNFIQSTGICQSNGYINPSSSSDRCSSEEPHSLVCDE
jgi:hypothetical protein